MEPEGSHASTPVPGVGRNTLCPERTGPTAPSAQRVRHAIGTRTVRSSYALSMRPAGSRPLLELQPDGLVDELVGHDVVWRQALLGRGALGRVDRHGQLDQLADPIGVEL